MNVRLGVAVESTRVSAVAVRRGRVIWAAEADYAGAGDLARVLGALASERPRGAREAAVALGAGIARVKTVEGLPRLGRRDLAAHVRLNSRRYFVQNGIPLVTDAAPLGTRNGSGPAVALLAGAPVTILEAVAAGLEAAGLRCRLIAPAELLVEETNVVGGSDSPVELTEGMRTAASAATARPAMLSLLPDGARARREFELHRSVRRWAAAAAAASLFALTSWLGGQLRVQRHAERELARLKPTLEAALSARRDLDATDQALALIAAMDGGSPHRGRFLADLTRALPDSAFLVSLRLDPDGAGSLSGYAPRAAAIVARLERAGLVRGATLEGPVTREVVAGRELERFALRFRAASPGRTP